MTIAAKRSSMILFSDPRDHYSHRVRMVLAEKGVTVELSDSTAAEISKDMFDLNPYGSLPTLADRDLVLYEANVIMEYLDERFPHPPLLPVDPISRAKFRLALHEIENQWYPEYIKSYNDEQLDIKFVDKIKSYFLEIAPLIKKGFFMSEDFGLVDASLAPLLWRLKSLDFDLAQNNKIISEYSERIFERESFQESLTESEKELF